MPAATDSLQLEPPAPRPRSGWAEVALLSPHLRWLALFSVAASFVLPADGFGVDICGLHRTTGLPCPGCGLTRAFISMANGDLSSAVWLNPFVIVLYPSFLLLAALAVGPGGMRERVERWMVARAECLGRVIRIGLLSFVGFGVLRLAWFLYQGERFP